MKSSEHFDESLQEWTNQKKLAVKLLSHIGHLMYDKGIELVLFRNPLIDISVPDILRFHEYAEKMVHKPITIDVTAKLAEHLCKMELNPSKIDIGLLANEWMHDKTHLISQKDFLNEKLEGFKKTVKYDASPQDVVLYGFGRIGRICAREIIKNTGKGEQLRLRAIVTRNNTPEQIQKRADLLRMDSVHGPFPGVVEVDAANRSLIINGNIVHIIQAQDPGSIDYSEYGIENALIIDNTGIWRSKETLHHHLKSVGTSQVILTAPGNDIPDIVYGINEKQFDLDTTKVWSAGSCTTNAIAPVLKVIHDNIGIEKGHIQSVHAYTNDQNLLDNMHSKNRRGRSAAINMVITETEASIAISKVIPDLTGKFTAKAVRVPTPNGSLAIISLSLSKAVTVESINDTIKAAALQGPLIDQIRYSIETELVSNDIIGNTCCSVFDSQATIVSDDGTNAVLYVWYDNEYGYALQVLRLAKHIGKVRRQTYF